MTIAVYPGTFDPITLGHMDIVSRATRLFDEVIVAVYLDAAKPGRMFDGDARIELIREAVSDATPSNPTLSRVRVEGYTGLSTEFARSREAGVIVRGLRAVTDFEYEFKLAHMNHHLAPEIEVVCLMTNAPQAFVSSSLIREVASLNGDVSGLVPANVQRALEQRFSPGYR
ncbi:MAG TPA: pantetheine-phosphate adenylyltransferase [Thermomicrobiales bacterium]|jgi:pantetheine-phosphate adenylyltransferase|nr:pantetheine-phosphate adenylyltransferase [Thermomicrobiales bacterium]